VPQSSQTTGRAGYIAGLHRLANWLEQNPDVGFPRFPQDIAVPLHTNAAVEEFACAAGVDVVTDGSGNTSASLVFGALTYRAYGYADWDQHLVQHNEGQASRWADKNGMVIQPREGGVA
jgi:hypothetical protein